MKLKGKKPTLRQITHYILLSVSTILTVSLLITLSNKVYYQILWGTLGVTIELSKDILVMSIKSVIKGLELKGRKWYFKALSVIPIPVQTFILAITIIVSLFASAGFALQSIQSQSFTATSVNLVIDNNQDKLYEYSRKIKSKTKEIEIKQKQMAELPAGWETASEGFSDQIKIIEKEIDEILVDKGSLVAIMSSKENTEKATNSADMFSLLGEEFDLDGKIIMKLLMFAIAITLEAMTAMTAGELKDKKKKKTFNLRKLRSFIDVLFDDKDKILRKGRAVQKKLSCTEKTFKEYQDYISSIQFNSIPLLEVKDTQWVSNFSKAELWNILSMKNKISEEGEK